MKTVLEGWLKDDYEGLILDPDPDENSWEFLLLSEFIGKKVRITVEEID